MEGALIVAGTLGYREASVRAILEHSGGHRAQFYEHFESKEDCFAQAYTTWIDRLGVKILQAALSADSWEEKIWAGVVFLARFVSSRPEIARAIFVEVQIAGEPALAHREAAMERLAAALDSVRDQLPPAEAPPEATAAFVLGGIDTCVCEALSAGTPERIWEALPELMHFAVGSYLDRDAAEAAFEDARQRLPREREQPIGKGPWPS